MQLHPEQLDEAELPRDENTSFLVIESGSFMRRIRKVHMQQFFLGELCFYETSSFYLHIYTGLGITTNIQRRKYLVKGANFMPFSFGVYPSCYIFFLLEKDCLKLILF